MPYSLEGCEGGVFIRRVNGVSTAVFIGHFLSPQHARAMERRRKSDRIERRLY